MEAADPQQDRNVEARASELLPCPFCGGTDLTVAKQGLSAIVICNKCFITGPGADSNQLAKAAFAAWNRRPSQPPQNVEAGDAAKGVVDEIEKLKAEYDDVVHHSTDRYEYKLCNLRKLSEKARNFLFSDRLRLALSATSSHGEKGMGEQKGEAGEMADLKEILAVVDDCYEATGHIKVCKTSDQRMRVEKAIITASSNAERLRKAEELLLQANAILPGIEYELEGHRAKTSVKILNQFLADLHAFLSPAPAQTPRDERRGFKPPPPPQPLPPHVQDAMDRRPKPWA